MDVDLLKRCLATKGCVELGIPTLLPSYANSLGPLLQWALEGTALEARQIWFCLGNADEFRESLPETLRNRILPLHGSKFEAMLRRGPYDALLLPYHGFVYSDPNLTLSSFWTSRGRYTKCEDWVHTDTQLWFWTPNQPLKRFFGVDHHHAVLWDVRQILRPLGIRVDFHWIPDGRPPVNEALPSEVPGIRSSVDLYKPPPEAPLPPDLVSYIHSKHYDGIVTSHSLVTCFRLRSLGLPMIHVNSTRFGNEWIHSPDRHRVLVEQIQQLLHEGRLTVVHNNKGDKEYFHQYFPYLSPSQDVWIPSLCEHWLRLRVKTPTPKLLLWDTRQVLLQEKGSPFLKELYAKCKQAWGDQVECQALLWAQKGSYLPEGYLDAYSAVIHIPYNISTMSIAQQVRSNIPIWVPSKQLLARLWSDPNEPNELSWTVFAPGSEATASPMDKARDPAVVERWIATADFYDRETLPLVFEFDSSEELVAKGLTTDYQAAIDNQEATQQDRRESILFAWEQVLQTSLKASKN